MSNTFFELDRLKNSLSSKGVDSTIVNAIVAKAEREIKELVAKEGNAALMSAVEAGAEKGSADFINQLHLDSVHFEVTTDSGELDFSTPPYPMLPSLLKNAKPMKDGSGAYKIIPVGKPGNKPDMSTTIQDLQRRAVVERKEQAKRRYAAIAPAESVNFKVASTKQDPNTQWVHPAKDRDFTDEVKAINANLKDSLDKSIRDIIDGYIDLY